MTHSQSFQLLHPRGKEGTRPRKSFIRSWCTISLHHLQHPPDQALTPQACKVFLWKFFRYKWCMVIAHLPPFAIGSPIL